MKKALVLIFALLLAAALLLPAAAAETDPYFRGGDAFPEYGEENSPFGEYSDEFTYPNMDDKMNDGVYTYGDDEYFDEYDGEYDGEDFALSDDRMADISATFVLVSVLVSLVLIVLLIIFTVKVVRSSKKLKKYRDFEGEATRGVLYYDPMGKIAQTPDFASRQNGSYGYQNGNIYGGNNGQNADFTNQNGKNSTNGGVYGE